MSMIQVGLVDATGKLDPDLVKAVADAVNVQVTQDLPQFWAIQATVRYLPNPDKVPAGVWPVRLVARVPAGGGSHFRKRQRPFARVLASDDWSIRASHEIIEMLVDPFGTRQQPAAAIAIKGKKIVDGAGLVVYLVEACDPCQARQYGYPVQGVTVSDFITPHYYDPVATPGTRYSFTGAILAPRRLLPGGAVSWKNPKNNAWYRCQYRKSPTIVNVTRAAGGSRS